MSADWLPILQIIAVNQSGIYYFRYSITHLLKSWGGLPCWKYISNYVRIASWQFILQKKKLV